MKIQNQQKHLQAASVRMEGMLKQMSSVCHDKDTAKSKLPKEMSDSLAKILNTCACMGTANFRQQRMRNILE